MQLLLRIFHGESAEACERLMQTASVKDCASGGMKDTAVVAIRRLSCLNQVPL